ncbi:MAG TPA: (Fe-S)-binding protein [bacterium]|nr:(Fe-S)-binding protein [bacterium]
MQVALFVTCLIDQLFPEVAEAAVSVLRRCGIEPALVQEQTCCGQIAFNDGFWPQAHILARRHLDLFESADAVVTPSGSCAAMVREFYPVLLKDDQALTARAHHAGERTYELTEFLIDVLHRDDVGARFPHRVTYHASCHGLRGLGVRDQPFQLLRQVRDLELKSLDGLEECCGFGGMFAVKFSGLSGSMLDAKIRAIEASGAEVVTATDASCLMHIDGGLRRRRSKVRALHLAEILASQ